MFAIFKVKRLSDLFCEGLFTRHEIVLMSMKFGGGRVAEVVVKFKEHGDLFGMHRVKPTIQGPGDNAVKGRDTPDDRTLEVMLNPIFRPRAAKDARKPGSFMHAPRSSQPVANNP